MIWLIFGLPLVFWMGVKLWNICHQASMEELRHYYNPPVGRRADGSVIYYKDVR